MRRPTLSPKALPPKPLVSPLWLGLLLVLATLLAYCPAWQGKPVWDDDAHIAKPELHSLSGLVRTWLAPGATQQYYPLVYSVFWVEHRLWGGSTLGYHLLNILLHAASALLLLRILRRLAVPGAWLAAAVFALHPIQVESVAWMTELKNTLSGLLCLGSVAAYLRFDESRSRRWWLLAGALFALGLTAKTAIAPLPAALAVLLWWRHGTLSWKRDLWPLAPWFALGLLAGLFTAQIERSLFGAQGAEFNFSFLERCLLAGHSLCFQLGKLFWPARLTFMYPRWDIRLSAWWQYLYPGTMLLALAGCWGLRGWSRGPLAALLWFAGLLFPALGFFNAYSFRYSFVNDHHQYLACLGPIVLAAAVLARLLTRWGWWGRVPGYGVCLGLLGTLAALTWQQSRMYTDVETLWRTTLARNPTCWMAHNNLGVTLGEKGRIDEAIAQFQESLRLNPNNAGAHDSLGIALGGKGQTDEAIHQFEEAMRLEPRFADPHNNLGVALESKGKVDEAVGQYQEALRLNPNYAECHNNLGAAFGKKGQIAKALYQYQEALRLEPNAAEAHYNLGTTLGALGQTEEAIRQYQEALRLRPDFAQASDSLARALRTRSSPVSQ